MDFPMPSILFSYQDIVDNVTKVVIVPILVKYMDYYSISVWVANKTMSMDCLDIVLPFYDAILRKITSAETLWDNLCHRYYFINI